MDISRSIGIKIRALRKEAKLSQAELAELIDRSTESISNLERGVSSPNLETLFRLSTKLEVPLIYFVEGFAGQSGDRERAELLSSLNAIAIGLSNKKLETAVNQLKALQDL